MISTAPADDQSQLQKQLDAAKEQADRNAAQIEQLRRQNEAEARAKEIQAAIDRATELAMQRHARQRQEQEAREEAIQRHVDELNASYEARGIPIRVMR